MNNELNEINKKEYKTLTPFKGWVIENFPFIEADFDAITNYQLICKVTEYLNTVIYNQNQVEALSNELVDGYNNLLNYVNSYFDNLDVQEEINTKLDEMAIDGTLTNLIKNYVDPIYQNYENEINEQINNMQIQINSVTNGSPLVASSISGMTDTSRVYVNTTDGKWYYYNGSSWQIGGTYQSTGISNDSIIPSMLFETLQNSLKVNDTTLFTSSNATFTKNKYIDGNGTQYTTDNKLGILTINVSSLIKQTLNINQYFNVSFFGSGSGVPLYIIFDSSNNILEKVVKTSTNWYENNIVIPENASTLILNINYVNETYGLTSYKINNYIQNESIKYNQLDSTLQSLLSPIVSSENLASSFIPNCFVQPNKQIVAANGYGIYKANVTAGKRYKVIGKQFYNNPIICYCNSLIDRNITKNDIVYSVGTNMKTNELFGNNGVHTFYIEIPSYCDYVLLNADGTKTPEIYEVTGYSIEAEETNILKDKKIVYDGDSIAESRLSGLSANGGAYAKIIADKTHSTYNNQAVSGGILRSATALQSQYHSVVDNLTNLPSDGDIYCFEGGINDFYQNATLGTFVKNDFTGQLDLTTVAGALEQIFRYSLSNFVGKPIVFVIVHKIQQTAYNRNTAGNTFEEYRNMMVAICNKYSIPYYDAFSSSGLNGWNTAQSNAFLTADATGTADGCHPNENGYKKYYVPELIKLFESII